MKPSTPPRGSRTSEQLIFFLFLGSLLTPFLYSETSFFGFITERTWFFYVVTDSMVVVALLTPGFLTTKPSHIQMAVMLFLGVVGLANGLGVDPLLSYFSSYTRLDGFLTYLHLGLYFLVLARTPLSKTQWNRALLLSVGIAALIVLKGYFSTTGWQAVDRRLVATVGNPSFLASYLLMNVFIAIYLANQFPSVSRWRKAVPVGATLLILAGGIYLTGTRSAVLGLVAGILYLSAFVTWQQHRGLSTLMLRLSLVIAGLIGLFWLALSNEFLQKSSIVSPTIQALIIPSRQGMYAGKSDSMPSPNAHCWGGVRKPLATASPNISTPRF